MVRPRKEWRTAGQGSSRSHSGDFVYIRNEGDGSEELFNQRDDPQEVTNLARAEAMLPVLRRFRDHVAQAKAHAPAVTDADASPRVASAPDLP